MTWATRKSAKVSSLNGSSFNRSSKGAGRKVTVASAARIDCVRIGGGRGVRHFHVDQGGEMADRVVRRAGEQQPSVHGNAIGDRAGGDEISDAALEGEHLAFFHGHGRRALPEHGRQHLGISARRQIENGDDDLAIRIFETGKPLAQNEAGRRREPDALAGREHRLGYGKAGAADKGRE